MTGTIGGSDRGESADGDPGTPLTLATTLTPTRAAAAAAADDDDGPDEPPTFPRPLVLKFSPVGLESRLGSLSVGGEVVICGRGRKMDPTVDGDENADEDPEVDRFDGTNCCCCDDGEEDEDDRWAWL